MWDYEGSQVCLLLPSNALVLQEASFRARSAGHVPHPDLQPLATHHQGTCSRRRPFLENPLVHYWRHRWCAVGVECAPSPGVLPLLVLRYVSLLDSMSRLLRLDLPQSEQREARCGGLLLPSDLL